MSVSVNGSVLVGVLWRLQRGCGWKRQKRQTDIQTYSPTPIPHILCLPFVMHPPHLQSCHWLVRTNHRTPCCLPAMYQFGQDDIKFLVLRVKDHMKTDVLITGPQSALEILDLKKKKQGFIFQINPIF